MLINASLSKIRMKHQKSIFPKVILRNKYANFTEKSATDHCGGFIQPPWPSGRLLAGYMVGSFIFWVG